jgi:hypothetical protein
MLIYDDTCPPKGRDRAECEALLRYFYTFCQPWESASIDAFLEKNPQSPLSKERLIEILSRPEKAYQKDYYAVLREVFMLEGEELEHGIKDKVGEFWTAFFAEEPCPDLKDIEFYLSP